MAHGVVVRVRGAAVRVRETHAVHKARDQQHLEAAGHEVLPGVVDIFHGWEKANVNKLTEREFDHVTGYPPFKSGLCQVERA